ncbi:MAG: hypothetical protein B7Y43_02820 [Sphingomonas sp. 28-62-20]|uniref:hypothetical protein n=1 Tax=unclassified Sphingomonas TaxID=196159 RepID=UPI000BD39052|nr:hypothetical protein [Sphingomonas sp.]OYY79365.1 MAG: hypothetical protein B7Y43_02820 [Sphingomonas sp. 28-62-20]
MTEAESSIMLEILKRLQSDMSEMKADMSDMRLRMTANEEHLATLVMSVSGINHRLDRLADRVERIERRLDLLDTH